jgi:NDP-sugar pyrophosphorylase family protein
MISKAMLMTAGLGTRMRPYTNLRTKALLPVMGVPSVQFSVDSLVRQGVTTFVANIHHRAEESRRLLEALDWQGAELRISDESDLLLGSAGAHRKALPTLRPGPYFLANADVISTVDWGALEAHHRRLRQRHGVSLTLALLSKADLGGTYTEVIGDRNGELILSLGKLSADAPFFTGAAVLEEDAFELVPESGPSDFIQCVLRPMIERRRAGCFLGTGSWFDMASPELWYRTHLELISRLDEDRFSTPGEKLLKKRLLSVNRAMGRSIWVEQSAKAGIDSVRNWQGRAYWMSDIGQSEVPAKLGPDAILYGTTPMGEVLQKGICYGGLKWGSG